MVDPDLDIIEFVAVASVERTHKPPPSALTPEHAAALASENRAAEGKKRRVWTAAIVIIAVLALRAFAVILAMLAGFPLYCLLETYPCCSQASVWDISLSVQTGAQALPFRSW